MHGTGEPLGRFTSDLPDGVVNDARQVAAVLKTAQRVLVCGNTGADGDVVGSTLALACALRSMGKDVVVYNDEPYPLAFAWLPGGDSVVDVVGGDEAFDCTVVVDAARFERLGKSFPEKSRRGVFCWIDHHLNESPPGDLNYIDLTAAAVGEQIALVLDQMGAVVDADVARCLYASLVADTGGFRYGNTSARVFRLAARLVELGVEPWEMTERVYESQDEARVRLLGRALDGLWRSPCGRVGVVAVKVADLVELGAVEEHVQGLVNNVRGIKGVEVAVLLRELEPEKVRVIFRSRGNVPITPIVGALGGKGSKNAGSAMLAADVDAARSAVIAASMSYLQSAVDVTMPGGNAE
jgi:phosphoesterase RecJ-like protein